MDIPDFVVWNKKEEVARIGCGCWLPVLIIGILIFAFIVKTLIEAIVV